MSVHIPAALYAPRFWSLWAGLGLLYLIGLLPPRVRRGMGAMLGRWLLPRNRKRMAIARTNLAWCYPQRSEAEREAVLQRFTGELGASYFDFGMLWWARRERLSRRMHFDGLAQLEALLAAGERVILVTGHSLAMDIGGVALSARVPLTTFANHLRNPLLDWLVAERRGRFGCNIFRRSDGIRPVVRELKAGRVLFFPADEDQGERQAETVFAPYFGVAKATLTSPLRLARMTGAKVIPCTTWFDYQLGCYRVKIYPPLVLGGEEMGADAAAMNRAFEVAINEAPEQYLWTQRQFTSRPDSSPAPYVMKGKPGSGPRPRPVPA